MCCGQLETSSLHFKEATSLSFIKTTLYQNYFKYLLQSFFPAEWYAGRVVTGHKLNKTLLFWAAHLGSFVVVACSTWAALGDVIWSIMMMSIKTLISFLISMYHTTCENSSSPYLHTPHFWISLYPYQADPCINRHFWTSQSTLNIALKLCADRRGEVEGLVRRRSLLFPQ